MTIEKLEGPEGWDLWKVYDFILLACDMRHTNTVVVLYEVEGLSDQNRKDLRRSTAAALKRLTAGDPMPYNNEGLYRIAQECISQILVDFEDYPFDLPNGFLAKVHGQSVH